MKLIVCLDDRNGMSFLGRRQSQDALLRKDLLAYVAGSTLSMNAYSAAQFEAGSPISTSEQPAACGYWFVENLPVEPLLPLEELVIYRWNRHYPSDKKFPLALALEGLQLAHTAHFPGSSHEKITREVYKK